MRGSMEAPGAPARRTFGAWRRRIDSSLRLKVAILASAFAVASLGVTCIAIGFRALAQEQAAANGLISTEAARVALAVEAGLREPFVLSHAIADALATAKRAGKPLPREQVDLLLRSGLEAHPDWIGFSSIWEPNALDGRDAQFVGAPGHDATGRYVTWWNRHNGELVAEPVVGYADPAQNAWYESMRGREGAQCQVYPVQVGGKQVTLATASVPIVVNGEFMGVVAVDFTLEGLDALLGKLSRGQALKLALLSDAGGYLSGVEAARLGKQANDLPAVAMNAVKEGRDAQWSDDDGWLHRVVPVRPDPQAVAWAVKVSYPEAVAMAPVRSLMSFTLTVALICALLMAALIALVVGRLMRPVVELSQSVESLASGDSRLDARLRIRGRDELARISGAFNCFIAKLAGAFGEAQDASAAVVIAARQISQGNADLSSRTETQASRLQEVAVAMTELRRSVEDNRQASESAAALCDEAHASSRKSEAVMAEALGSMKMLQQASSNIAEITGAIQGIAFQTNVLTINASIEAARAGNAGKGFSVVASEVRVLAERSAEAARGIKALIERAVQQIETASERMGDTDATVRQLVISVQQVTALTGRIAIEGRQQSQAITSVTESLSGVERSTQQNAALVEELAAASESMHQRADRLLGEVGRFLANR
jgi:methyl-accepting chemotaxis protein